MMPTPTDPDPDPEGFPSPSTAPDRIYENSTNGEVKLYVYYCLLRNEEDLSKQDAWNFAKKIIGNGHSVLRFKEQDWVEQIGGSRGRIINRDIEESKYVHTDTIWPWLQFVQILLLALAAALYGYDLKSKNDLKTTKTIGIAFLVYTAVIRLFYTIASSRFFERNQSIPTFFKSRPPGPAQNFWIPSFGAAPP